MPEFLFQEMFPHGEDTTPYRKLSADHVGTARFNGRDMLTVEPEALTLLRRCAEAARPAGRVVVLSGVAPDGEFGPPPALLMMVLVGGKERSLTEFRALAGAAGLTVQTAARQPSGRFVVECRPG